MTNFDGLLWSEDHVHAMVDAVATEARLEVRQRSCVQKLGAREAIEWAGFESEAMPLTGTALEHGLRAAAPALIETAGRNWLGLVDVRRGSARLVGPAGVTRSVALDHLCASLQAPAELPHVAEVDELLDSAGVAGKRRATARQALLRERLRNRTVARAWTVRTSPGASFRQQLRVSGVTATLARFVACSLAEYLLMLSAWWLIGRGALEGRVEWGWLSAWALALLTIAPFRLCGVWSQGMLGLGLGGLLKQRLMTGALRADPDELRALGSGQMLGRVMEAEQVEALALTGGLGAVVAGIELILAGLVLGLGAGGWIQAAALAAWTALVLGLSWIYGRRRQLWTERRVEMTNSLVEAMAGHRTRLAQLPPEQWHTDDDVALERYLAASRKMDSALACLTAVSPRGWLLAGVITLLPAFAGSGRDTLGLAASLGGVLLAYRAFRQFASSLAGIAGAGIAWSQVRGLFRAAAARHAQPQEAVPAVRPGNTLLVADDLSYRYSSRDGQILRNCSLRIEQGDWLLLEGPSGGGKSTLAALLTGMRRPSAGLLLAGGYDRGTLGDAAWRRSVASAPQYHENHVLAGTFLFNLLMGRHWPPSSADMDEAEEVCRELGLGPLLERMPAGMMQIVGETGWQLSQGERSRMFLTRALLQGGQLIVLDESFAALDPETLAMAYACVNRRAKTLLLIAHP